MLLDILSRRHAEWLRMVRSFGSDYDTANDVVQDMYIKMHSRFENEPERVMFEDGEVNTYYVFVTLRNLYVDTTKGQKFTEIHDVHESDMVDHTDRLNALEALISAMEGEINSWRWYDRELFNVYHTKGFNIRQISEGTKITERSIWNTLNNGKKRIKSNCGEQYEAYKKAKKG